MKPNKKNMNYFQAMKYYHLDPYGDADKDKTMNFLDCRPFDPDKHFMKIGDIKTKLIDIGSKFKKSKPTVEIRKPISRAPEPSKYKPPKKIYLYVKVNGKWSYAGAFDEGTSEPLTTVKKLYSQKLIESHEFSNSPNDAKKLNIREKIEPVLKHTGEWIGVSKKHWKEETPKIIESYKKRIGLPKGQVKAELGRRIIEGLEIRPSGEQRPLYVPRERPISFESDEIPKFGSSETETIKPEIEEDIEMEEHVEIPSIEMEQRPSRGIEISPGGFREIEPQQPLSKNLPPVSRGWAGSIGGSRPYQPLPYKPTGKIIFTDKQNYSPMPKIPVFRDKNIKFSVVKDVTAEVPFAKIKFVR